MTGKPYSMAATVLTAVREPAEGANVVLSLVESINACTVADPGARLDPGLHFKVRWV